MDASEPIPEIGTRLLFENDRMRLWTMEVAPGDAWGPHEHHHAYVTVVAEPARIASVMGDGTVELEIDAEVDRIDWHEAPAAGDRRVHTLENRGNTFYKNFIIELLEPPR